MYSFLKNGHIRFSGKWLTDPTQPPMDWKSTVKCYIPYSVLVLIFEITGCVGRMSQLNSLALGDAVIILRFDICTHVTYSVDQHFLLNYSHGNITEHLWWQVNIGLGNGSVSSGNTPLPQPMLTQFTDALFICTTRLQYTKGNYFFNLCYHYQNQRYCELKHWK